MHTHTYQKRYCGREDNWWKRLEGQETMALGFIDLKKAYDSSDGDGHGHDEVGGCPEAEVRIFKGT